MSRVVWWLVALAVPLLFVALNVRILASDTYLRLEYGRLGLPAAQGLSDDERLELARPSTAYVVGGVERSDLEGLRLHGKPLYSDGEVEHLVDVRRLVGRLTVLGSLSLAWVCALGLVSWRDRPRRAKWWRAVGRGGLATVAFVCLAAVGVMAAWRTVFMGFHELLFPPGTWQFAADSGLIRLFPERFWYDSAVAFALVLLVEGVLVFAVARWGRRAALGS